MAITRAQQVKQLLKEGGRTGFFLGGDSDYTSPSKEESRSRTDRAQAAAAAENRESRRGTIGSYTSTPQTEVTLTNKRTGQEYNSDAEAMQDVQNPSTDTTSDDIKRDVRITVEALPLGGQTKL